MGSKNISTDWVLLIQAHVNAGKAGEKEADQKTPGAEALKPIPTRWVAPGHSLRGWPRTEDSGELWLAAQHIPQ